MLKVLRLRKPMDAVFVRGEHSTLKLLKLLKDFVCFGTISEVTMRNLIYKRGQIRLPDGKQISLTDNQKIEEGLGSLDILCVEDLIYEIVNCSEKFKSINNFLSVFELATPQNVRFGELADMDKWIAPLI